jgi:hypothetical protein
MKITEGNIDSIVDFDYQDYLRWLDPDVKSQSIWYGTCLQFSGEEGKTFALISLITCFQDLISFLKLDCWVMKHEDKDFPWIPEEDLENEFLGTFKKLLADNHISSQHSGALMLNESELKSIVDEMLYYPINLSYKNIDFIPLGRNILIKVTHHLDLCIISMSENTMNELAQRAGEHFTQIRMEEECNEPS